MKHLRYHLALTIALFTLFLVLSITFAWYINGKLSTNTPIIQAEEIEGINLYLYRGNDYYYDGSLDPRDMDDVDLTVEANVLELNKDLNKTFFSLEGRNDKITHIMDNNIVTYRLRIVNDTDKEYYLNPYFIFKDDSPISPYNSILFRLRDLTIYNHTFLDKDGNFINYFGDNHFDITTKEFYEVDVRNGLFDTYGNPITRISNGTNYYDFTYDSENSVTSITYNGETLSINSAIEINLSEYYNSTPYLKSVDGENINYEIINKYTNSTINLYDTKYSDSNYLCNMKYNAITNGSRYIDLESIGEGIEYETKTFYPANKIDIGKNLSLFMFNEKIKEDEIIIDSYSEYYIDYHIVVDSNLSSLSTALEIFASSHNLDMDNLGDNDFSNAYTAMLEKYSEMVTNSEIAHPNFKIENFCFDMKLINEYSSYVKKRGKIGDKS